MSAEAVFRDTVNDALAQLLPYAPRDFVVKVALDPGVETGHYSAHVNIVAKTEMGKAIQPVLQRKLSIQIGQIIQQQGGSYDTSAKAADTAD
jgi:hypothetical protein